MEVNSTLPRLPSLKVGDSLPPLPKAGSKRGRPSSLRRSPSSRLRKERVDTLACEGGIAQGKGRLLSLAKGKVGLRKVGSRRGIKPKQDPYYKIEIETFDPSPGQGEIKSLIINLI